MILYEILTLERPFTGKNAAEIIAKITSSDFIAPAPRVRGGVGQAPRLPQDGPARQPERLPYKHLPDGRVPESLDAIVRKAMALDPAARYANVGALQADLLAYQNGFATSAEEKTAWKQLRLFVRRNKAVATRLAAALAVLAAVTAAFTIKVLGERDRPRSPMPH